MKRIRFNVKLHEEGNIIEVIAKSGIFKKKEIASLKAYNLIKFYNKNLVVITQMDYINTKAAISIIEMLKNFLIELIPNQEFVISTGRFLEEEDKDKLNIFKLLNFQEKERIYQLKYDLEIFYYLKKTPDNIALENIKYINPLDLMNLYNDIFEDKLTEYGAEHLIKQRLLINNASFYLISDEKPIGFILTENIQGKAYISYIGVVSYKRRKGLGSYLLSMSLKNLKALGFSEVFAYVSLTNQPALNFFKKLGFKQDKIMIRLDNLVSKV
jgi:ribosomal protein S18 acetylase RimI-like enzyme